MATIAILGGSFNPPHVGHLLAATFAHATFAVDEVWLMPSFRHPFGKPLESFAHRVAMCRALTHGLESWLKVSEVEQDVPGEGRTVDTLVHLKAIAPEHDFQLLIGSDILRDLPNWKEFDRIRALAQVRVLPRAGYPAAEAKGPSLVQVSSTEIRERLKRQESAEGFLPWRVHAYARQHRLYGLSA